MSPRLRENGPALAACLLVAAAIKLGYSRLGPDELVFITDPTQRLVTLLTGIGFTYEPGYGYVNLSKMLVIAKSCAGVNYLLAVFGTLAFTLVPAGRGKLLMVGAAAACAYVITVLTNAVRIAIGIALQEYHAGGAWLTPENVHRLAGILVYVAALLAAHRMARSVLRVGPEPSTLAMPLLWYVLITVALPAANGALQARPALFLEHTVWVLATLLAVCAVMWSVRGVAGSLSANHTNNRVLNPPAGCDLLPVGAGRGGTTNGRIGSRGRRPRGYAGGL
jgi:exosortase K